jgi:hypothetical protein
MNQDAEHLNLLSIFYYITGALSLIGATIIVVVIIVQAVAYMNMKSSTDKLFSDLSSQMQPVSPIPGPTSPMSGYPLSRQQPGMQMPRSAPPMPDPKLFNPTSFMATTMITYAIIGGLMGLLMVALGICQIMAGRKLKECKSKTFCQVIAGITCLHVPTGTVLGVLTYIVMNRPSVMTMFEPNRKVSEI